MLRNSPLNQFAVSLTTGISILNNQRNTFMRKQNLVVALAIVIGACASEQPSDAAAFTSDRITIATQGTGADIILVPGVGAHSNTWAAVADSLDEQFRLHIVQINGFAGAPPGANDSGFVSAPVAEEIARYIRETGLERPAIVGHSMGGAIGIMVAATHPDLLGRLMVVDMTPNLGALLAPPGSPPESIRVMADQLRDGFLRVPADSATMLEQMIPSMTRNDSARAVLLQYARASYRPTLANAMHELMVTDLRPQLSAITVPFTALYVVPGNLPMTPDQFDAGMRESYANARNARLVRVDSSNHYIHFDQPGRVVSEIRTFMTSAR
jgi:pimeloyl-ACP methyl ester carboxylesterase